MRLQLRQIGLLVGAVACFTLAGVLLIRAGLPNRADYVGIVLTPGSRPIAPALNAFAPPFELPTLTGERLALMNLRGERVIVNFWATWCEPCRLEMPALQVLYTEVQARGESVRIIGVNLGESAEIAGQWVEDFGLTFDIALDIDGYAAALYQLRGQPTTVLIDRDGIIQHIIYGAADINTLRQLLETF